MPAELEGERWRAALFGLLVVAVALLACATTEDLNEKYKADLLRRASFDLNCQQRVLTKPLQENGNGLVTSYGVTACGKRATYVLMNTGAWVMNVGPEAKPSESKP